jgi:hypothetical protein
MITRNLPKESGIIGVIEPSRPARNVWKRKNADPKARV